MRLTPARARRLATGVAAARVALGVVAMTLPALPLAPWIGDRRKDPGALVLARALGARDAALGLGLLLAARHEGPLRGWVEAGGLADTGDAVFTLAALRTGMTAGKLAVLGAAGGGVLAARLIAPVVDSA